MDVESHILSQMPCSSGNLDGDELKINVTAPFKGGIHDTKDTANKSVGNNKGNIVTCQANPVLVKSGSNVRFVSF